MGRKRTIRTQNEEVKYLGTKVTESVYNDYHKLAKSHDRNVGLMMRELVMKEIENSKQA